MSEYDEGYRYGYYKYLEPLDPDTLGECTKEFRQGYFDGRLLWELE